jgi:MoxR-like ATPase
MRLEMNKQQKIKGMYEFVKDNLYFCLDDIAIGEDTFNSTLIFEFLTHLNKGKQMLFGEYGLGKTTSSENVTALMEGLPLEVILSAEVRGHPEQTEEKMLARPDLGELNLGNEKVLWSYFVLNSSKILDEINRLPPSKLNVMLDGIDRGNWKYLSDMIQNGDFTLFATCNYADSGNSDLNEAALDRFDIATESKRPSLMQLSMIKDMPRESKAYLSDAEVTKRVLAIYDSKTLSYQEKLTQVSEIKEQFKEDLEGRIGIPVLSTSELNEANAEIKEIKFSDEADLFYTFLLAELASCQTYGMKRATESCPSGCHFLDYGCGQIENGLSVRGTLAISKYAKSLAWLGEKDAVTVDDIEKVVPYAIWHKMEFSDNFVASLKDDQRTDPLELYAAKRLVADIKQRFVENVNTMSNYVVLMRDGNTSEAAKLIEDKDHPVFKEFNRMSWLR